ncbi:MAG: RsmE family RNA methyltransferase [Candidatus Gygaella obscura]|nr:RsmE family RNA methyltransferase [Candidatus Gygaella obscura]
MRRFFCQSRNILSDKIIIDDSAEIHHIKNVSRFKIKDIISVFDEQGAQYKCFIDSFGTDNIRLKIIAKDQASRKSNVNLTVCCAIAKGNRFTYTLEKLTELGVGRIIPLMTKRTIPNVTLKKDKKIERWKKIILAACKQSFRKDIPEISLPLSFEDALLLKDEFSLKMIAYKHEESIPLKEVLENNSLKNVILFIGPEGDFTSFEITQAKKNDFILVSLGRNTLRVDTASIYSSSVIMSYE